MEEDVRETASLCDDFSVADLERLSDPDLAILVAAAPAERLALASWFSPPAFVARLRALLAPEARIAFERVRGQKQRASAVVRAMAEVIGIACELEFRGAFVGPLPVFTARLTHGSPMSARLPRRCPHGEAGS